MENGLLPVSPAVLPLIFHRLLGQRTAPFSPAALLMASHFHVCFPRTTARSASIFSVSVDAVLISFGQHKNGQHEMEYVQQCNCHDQSK